MKSKPTTRNWYKWLSIVCLTAFIIGIGVVLNFLIGFPNELLDKLSLASASHINALKPLMSQMMTLIGITFAFALLALLFTIMYFGEVSKNRQVIYVEQTLKEDEVENKAARDEEQERQTLAQVIESRTQELSAKLNKLTPKSGISELEQLLATLCEDLGAVQGSLFVSENGNTLHLSAGYAYFSTEKRKVSYELGEGLTGQVAKEGRSLNVKSIPDGYITVLSGLGKTSPQYMIIAPIKNAQDKVVAVVEIASFKAIETLEESLIASVSAHFAAAIENNYEKIAKEF
jgi:Na+-transporting methylmalonyl-CoA/oxaloacetate decarboxylase gamma subunit